MAPATGGRPEGVGARIHLLRVLRDYSLRDLAHRSHVSKSMLSDVERGERQPSEQVIAALAKALGVSVPVIHGQPYIEQLRQDQLDQLIAPLSSALDDWDIPPAGDVPPPRPTSEMQATARHIYRLRSTGEFGALAKMLPGALAEVSHAVLDAPTAADREVACWLQSEAALGAFSVAYKLGYLDLARLALARMATAAVQSGDPRQVAVERLKRAQLSAHGPAIEMGLRLVNRALADLDDDGTPPTRAVRGGLMLKGVQLYALSGKGDDSDTWLDEAQGLARELGETGHYGMVFGPTNVWQHGVAAAGDRDEHGLALARAANVHLPEGYSPLRAGQFLMDRARSQALTAQPEEALESLQAARQVTPQQTRYHPTMRETVGTLLRARRASRELREFALWSGV
ncbi:transcriptional regulator with XRE-family HTH domain [Streptomyces zagrosensis]|uniref:Transcriptional regulator with XRE-family HTH domain n=2 Tax=Streptomyces zagrosensis TaxID=1042984 RepID=A0A7W9UZ34_9ACTN|nr:transcriptional regulator with XRE-family HTH domain [Streptomyces zagrosensis]